MAIRQSVVAVALLVFAAAMAAEGAGKSGSDCMSLVMQDLGDCLSYVTNATVEKPEGTCCSGLKTVLKTNPKCLCDVFKSSAMKGISVNVTRALTLPSACHLKAPSVDKCGVAVPPAGAPVVSPSGAPPSIAVPPKAAGGMVPAAAPVQKGSSSTLRSSAALLLTLIVGAIFTSFYDDH